MSEHMSEHMSEQSMDVVSLLKTQHEEIRERFARVLAATGDDRQQEFRELVRLLVVHETAEEEVVHPYARRTVEGGQRIVADRLREEEEATRMLDRLENADTNTPDFLEQLVSLRDEVLAHAEAEEQYEFARLHRETDRDRLEKMARAVKTAEAFAPTHPHPKLTGSPAKNLALGPLAAVADRTRDAVRKAMGDT
jgi:hemerythrin superfamily protein